MPIFEPNASNEKLSSPNGEFFWHATTIENIFKMIQFDNAGLRPVGEGQLGPGFYVTGVRSDYQKAMARRSRKEAALDVPLFLLYVFVENFYTLKPLFLRNWSRVETTADFIAVSWYMEGQGGVGEKERGGFMPSKATGQRTEFKYGQYQEEQIADSSLLAAMKNRVTTGDAFMQTLWGYASAHRTPAPAALKELGDLGLQTALLGPKKQLKRSMLELAFKTMASLGRATVVGAKLFSPTTEPVKLKFEYDKKNYSLTDAIVEPKDDPGENPLNFHDEKWVDLETLMRTLKSGI